MGKVRRPTSRDLPKRAKIEAVGPSARVEGVSLFDVDKILTFTMPNYWFSPAYRRHVWDGKIHFLKGKWFPAGFVNRVRSNLAVPTDVVWHHPDVYNLGALEEYLKRAEIKDNPERDYQEAAIKKGAKERLGIISLAANAGKGRCIGGIVAAFPNSNFIILANRTDVLSEINEALQEFLPGAENYTLCTFQSAKKFDLEIYDGVLVDEAHVSAAKTFYQMIAKCINATIRLGFTATPKRGDGLGFYIEAALGEVICTISQKELIKRGISAKPKIYLIPFEVPFTENDDYKSAESMLTNCKERNQLIANILKDKDEVLVLCKRREHGRLLEELIEGSVRIDGTTPQSERDKVKKDFKKGLIRVLLATSILEAGVNLPNIRTLFLAWGGKSPIELPQKIGRGVRITEGKDEVDVFALYEIGNRYFREHSKRRIEQFAEMGFEMEVMKDGILCN